MVYFDVQNNIKNKNFGFKNIDASEDNNININSSYFRYYFNELNAYGNKNENNKIKNNKMKSEFLYKNENHKLSKLNNLYFNIINPPEKTIQEITNFYKKLSEESRILPIYINYLEKIQDSVINKNELYNKIMRNFLILQNVYQNIKKEDEKIYIIIIISQRK